MILLEEIKNNIEIKGIIQVGANTGQEVNQFKTLTNNIILFEPIPENYNFLKNKFSDCLIFGCALGEENTNKPLLLASNNGESSSFLKPLNHLLAHPSIHFNNSIDVDIKRFDSLEIDIEKYNVLISDTQGYELKVLSGFGDSLLKLDAIIVEYINIDLYENDAKLEQITEYLKQYNFYLYKTDNDPQTVGNVLYLKV